MIEEGKGGGQRAPRREAMRHARSYPNMIRRWYRPVEHECLECHRTLREAVAVSRRTVITLAGVIKLNHAGYRCPDAQCAGHQRTYRSVEADALALPHFTYGLDIVLLVGRLRLKEHQTVDEIHQEVLRRLEPLGEKNGGIIVSVDGIQPEKGNETVYLVRDALTGRVLAAENVTSSETAVMKALLAP